METLTKRVIVPIDFSEASEHAAVYAAGLARQLGASVHFVHASEPEEGPRADRAYWLLRHRLVAFSDRIASGIEHSSEIRQGDPIEAIIAAVTDYGADLVVMSTHGRSGLSHLLMGSIAEEVIRSVRCPVLVIRNGGQAFQPHAVAWNDATAAVLIRAND
jgi:universal stress protein A